MKLHRSFLLSAAGLLAVLVTAAFPLPLAAAPSDARPPQASAEFMFGIPAGTDLEKIVDKPLLVGTHNYVFTDPAGGERRLGGYAEVVAVYDIPLEELVAVSLDFESFPDFVPRIYGTKILSRSGQVWRLQYNAGIKFLGIDVTYDSVFETIVEQLPGGGVGIRSHMLESLDDSAYEAYNSFYFCPVTVRGKTMTFIRYFDRPGIRKPSAGMLQVLNLFAPPEARGQVSAIAKEAVRRSKQR